MNLLIESTQENKSLKDTFGCDGIKMYAYQADCVVDCVLNEQEQAAVHAS